MEKIVRRTDWKLLGEQKEELFRYSLTHRKNEDRNMYEAIEGILNFIDAVQDHLVDDIGYDEETIYPELSEEIG
jgi:hypothetical protein